MDPRSCWDGSRGPLLRTAASTPCVFADVCYLGQGWSWGKASLQKVSVPQRNLSWGGGHISQKCSVSVWWANPQFA